jgi:hypothetical protein
MMFPAPEDKRKIEKYLERHQVKPVQRFNLKPIKVVIPSYAESAVIFDPLESLAAQRRFAQHTEAIIVVNNPEHPHPAVFADNQNTISLLQSDLPRMRAIRESGLTVTVVDRSSPGVALPEKIAGVGAARKAGLDQALALLRYEEFKGLLVSLDADCRTEPNYLEQIALWGTRKKNAACAIVEYAHPIPNDPDPARAIALYEIRLRYTELGLRMMHSPYAFPTIGSTIVCTPQAYVSAGGMNTRKATEDFYFLMNMAKHSTMDRINSTRVFPSARVSDRVYLGTGHGVGRLMDSRDEPLLEHPDCYRKTGEALGILVSGHGADFETIGRNLSAALPEVHPLLLRKGLDAFLPDALSKTRSEESYARRVHQWFDGLLIRQAVHHLRDNYYGELPWHEALHALSGIRYSKNPVDALLFLRKQMLI